MTATKGSGGGSRAARVRATAIGGCAVLLWSLLALFTTWAAGIPPFQLVAMTFAIAFVVGLGALGLRRRSPAPLLRQPWRVYALGVGGLFGYHFFYFVALGNAPAVEASLIAFLWPLLIVLFSALLPGERLRWWHVVGAVMGLGGAAILVAGGARLAFKGEFALGYAAALACALTWSTYSVASRRYRAVPSDIVTVFCLATALLAALCHLAIEETVVPRAAGWLGIVLLGLGPVGGAFYVWDHGIKHGDIRALGAFSYAAPLLSTLFLILAGKATASWTVAAACLLIVGGAVLAARDLLRRSAD